MEQYEYIKMDYSLETPEERNEKVKEIIANTPSERLTPRYLEKLADYIIFAMDKQERKKNIILTDNHMVTVNKRETSFEGLAGKLENGEDGLYNMIANDKNIIFSPKVGITEEDLNTIPGLKELVESISVVAEEAKWATGRRKFLLMRQLIEMRQDQYVLKNSYRQPIYSKGTIKAISKINLQENIWMDAEGEIHSSALINFFEPAHIVALLCNYGALKQETWNKFNSDIKWMLMDLDNLIDKALKDKYPLYYDLLKYKTQDYTNAEIQLLLLDKYKVRHSIEYISALWRNKIPKLIQDQAVKDWLEFHYTTEEKGHWKKCSRCNCIKLANNRFFSRNNTSKDGFYSICKECRNKKTKMGKKG